MIDAEGRRSNSYGQIHVHDTKCHAVEATKLSQLEESTVLVIVGVELAVDIIRALNRAQGRAPTEPKA